MAKNRPLFYGRLSVSNTSLFHRNGTNAFIRVTYDCTTSSKTLTNVTNVGGAYHGIQEAMVGQQLVTTTQFPSGTTITAIDTVANTIEVEDFPAADGSGRLGRISPPKGQYYVESGSIVRPQEGYQVSDFDLRYDFTGSHDDEFDTENGRKVALLLIQSYTSSTADQIDGDFAIYEVTRVLDRLGSSDASFYISSSVNGMLAEEHNKAPWQFNNTVFYELSVSSSLPPILDGRTLTSFPAGGFEFAGYNAALQEYYDDIRPGIFHSSSLVEGNADFLNFTGSAIKSITTESINGQNGVLIEIEGGGGDDTFPYTGSAEITGSLAVTGSAIVTGSFEVETNTTSSFTVNADGQVQLFAHENSYNPTPLLGGIYFTSQSVFLGLED